MDPRPSGYSESYYRLTKHVPIKSPKKKDEKLRVLIHKDVIRTLPEYSLQSYDCLIKILEEVLYVWSRENPDYEY